MLADNGVERHDRDILRNGTLDWPIRFKNPDASNYDLTGLTIKLHVSPAGADDFIIEANADLEKHLTVDAAAGLVTVFMAQAWLQARTWKRAQYRVDFIAPSGSVKPRLHGLFTLTDWA